jgi:tetratricopeptide (TPR) repeat protein
MSCSRIALALGFFVTCTGLIAQQQPGWEALIDLARAQTQAGKLAQAEQTYKAALAEVGIEDPPLGLHLVVGSLAELYRQQNRLDETEALYRSVLASQERRFGPSHRYVAPWLLDLGRLLVERGEYREAQELALRAVAIHEVQPAPHNANLRGALQFLIRLYKSQDRLEDAAAVAQRVLDGAQERVRDAEVRFGPEHPALAGAFVELAQAYSETGQFDQAEAQMQHALKIYESSLETYPELSMPYSSALRRMAEIYSLMGRAEDSRELLARAQTLTTNALHYERPAGDR